jgi:putative DNA primase/helicase
MSADDLFLEFAAQCDKADISRLAALSSFEYGRVRAAEAKRFNLTVEWLDKTRAEAQKKAVAETPPPMPERWQLEPWGEPVDGADLLDDLRTTFERYVVLPEHGSVTMALWVVHTWAIDAAFVSAFLMFNSPEMRCGKSTALGLVKRVSRRAVMASNISPSAVFRYIDAQQPTLAIDEAETFFTDNEEMRGILNSGHTRDTASVIRLVGEDHEAKEFSTWGPKAIASISDIRPVPRRGLSRDEAAMYVGISVGLFDRMLTDGRMPPPRRIDGRKVWDIRSLDVAFDRLPVEDSQGQGWEDA